MRVFDQSYLHHLKQSVRQFGRITTSAVALSVATVSVTTIPTAVFAQSTAITGITVDGNKRIATSTILSLANLDPGRVYTGGQINAAVQRLNASGFFKTVDFSINSGRVTIVVDERPTINRISFEGNKKIKDDDLRALIASQPRQTFSATRAESDAQQVATAYSVGGRITAQITPKLIERSDNRVDLVFQIVEGRVTEIQKITFVGNRDFSERRLRGALETKQAGIARAVVSKDTFIEDRLQLDKQNLRDFYVNRGYVDFQVLSTSAELTRDKDAFLLNFTVEEGQQYSFGEVTMLTSEDDIDIESFQKLSKIKEGRNYDPRKLETLIQEVDVKLGSEGFPFVSAAPRLIRDDDRRVIDVEIDLTRGRRLFVERIDIEGNSTTLDSVIRRQFELAEGDAFNRREIQEATDRIRATGLFKDVQVEAREGSSPDQAIVDVNVVEQQTGNLGLGAGYNSSDGATFNINLEERNFLGRGQTLRLDLSNSSQAKNLGFTFTDPSFLDRDVSASLRVGYKTASIGYIPLDTTTLEFSPSVSFPIGKFSRFSVGYTLKNDEIKVETTTDNTTTPPTETPVAISPILTAELGKKTQSSLILGYTYDKRNSVIEPTAGFRFSLNQQFTGLGGDQTFSKTSLKFKTYTTLFNDNFILSAGLDAGAIMGDGARVSDRFFTGGDELRGFESFGIGPRDTEFNGTSDDGTVGDALGGKFFVLVLFGGWTTQLLEPLRLMMMQNYVRLSVCRSSGRQRLVHCGSTSLVL